jgi:hypothetical protein
MDNSPEYVKMCEKAKEIQVLKDTRRDGDVYYVLNEGRYGGFDGILFNCHDVFEEYSSQSYVESYIDENTKNIVWLPRQDQLQEMVMPKRLSPRGMYPAMHLTQKFSGIFYNHCFRRFKTMEQLWLAFVMQQKYCKTWNGEEWERV